MSLSRFNSTQSVRKGGKQANDENARSRDFSLGSRVPSIAQDDPAEAIQVSQTWKISQIVTAVIYCLFASGVVFGFAALKPVLVEEGVYRDQCTAEELDKNVWVCSGQELRLNFMFTVAAVSSNVGALPAGTILDRYGPRVCGPLSVFFIALGCILLAFARQLPFDGYIPGYFFLALGGPFILISSFHLSNAFPRYSGLVLALLTGAFDASSALFLVYRLMYEATGGRFGLKKFFLSYLTVPIVILLIQLFLMPRKSYKAVDELSEEAKVAEPGKVGHQNGNTVGAPRPREETRFRSKGVSSETAALLGETNSTQSKSGATVKLGNCVRGALYGQSAYEQIMTPWWLLLTLFTMVQMTRINYFIATIRLQYEHLLRNDKKAVQINEFFDVAFPIGGALAVPFIGPLLDGTSTTFVLALLVTAATVIGVLGVIGQTWAAYANVALFVLYRPLYYTAIADYAGKVFGYDTFGKVYGLVICLAGLCNFLRSALDALTQDVFKGDPTPVNFLLLVVAFVVGVGWVGYVWQQSGRMSQENWEREAEGAKARLLPDGELGSVDDNHPVELQGGRS